MSTQLDDVGRGLVGRRVLFICGSINQTKQMHKIAEALPEVDAAFTPYYATGFLGWAQKVGFLEMTIAGRKLVERCRQYLEAHNLPIDYRGEGKDYDLVLSCTDQIIQNNIKHKPVVLVQEGMLDPTNIIFTLSKYFRLIPRWLAGTAASGQSKNYRRFCVASEGYVEYFLRHGLDQDRMVVTGIPNFDDCARYYQNSFPHKGYVLVCTSDARETFKYDNRKAFIQHALEVARGRQLLFKLHPNERFERAKREIETYAPGSLIYRDGVAEEMVANSDAVVCQYSTLAFVALALNKETHSYFKLDELRRLLPVQNGGTAAEKIASVCREVWQEVVEEQRQNNRRNQHKIAAVTQSSRPVSSV